MVNVLFLLLAGLNRDVLEFVRQTELLEDDGRFGAVGSVVSVEGDVRSDGHLDRGFLS